MKKTATAPANVGLIKYWGRKDELLRIPENGSISVNLSGLTTTTTVEFDTKYKSDQVLLEGIEDKGSCGRVIFHLDRIRKFAGVKTKAKVISQNSFPSSTGLSSSSSGFAALTLASCEALGLQLTERELSSLARLGSGSAARSIPDGFVEWQAGNSHTSSYAFSIFPPDYWDIVDIVAIASTAKKEVSSSTGQTFAASSLFYPVRLSGIEKKLHTMKTIIEERNFPAFGELLEQEAFELHAVMMTSKPPLFYWTAHTVSLMKKVREWRKDGLPVYFTINTGQDVHFFCERKSEQALIKNLRTLEYVRDLIINTPSIGARLVEVHLF